MRGSRNWSVRARLVLAFVGVLIPYLLLAGIGAVGLQAVWQRVQTIHDEVAMEFAGVANLQLAVAQLVMPANDYLITGDPKERIEFEQRSVRVHEVLAGLTAHFTVEERQLQEAVRIQVSQIETLSRGILAIPDPRVNRAAPAKMKVLDRMSDEAAATLGRIYELSLREIEEDFEHGSDVIRWVAAAGVAALLLSVAGGVGLALIFSTWLSRPILAIAHTSRRMADGDLSRRVEAHAGGELGETARAFNEMAERLETSHRFLQRRNEELAALNSITTTTSRSLEVQEVLARAVDAVLDLMRLEAGEIFLVDDAAGEVVLAMHRGYDAEAFWEIPRFKLGEGFPGRVALSGEPLVTTDLAKDLRFLRKHVIEAGFSIFASIPMKAGGKVVGTLNVASRGPRAFTEGDLSLLTAIGATIGMAIVNARLYEARRAAEIRFRTLFEQAPGGIVVVDPKTALPIEFNETAHRQLGYSREEFARLRISDYEAAETPEETKAHVEKILREGQGDFETQHRTKQGDIRDVLVTVRMIELSGRPVCHAIFRDITERKRVEKALLGLYRTTPAWQFLDVNLALVKMLGYPDREALLAINVVVLYVNPEDRKRWQALMEYEGFVRGFEVRFRRYDGTIVWVENTARVNCDADGRVLYYEESNQDISERKRSEEIRHALYQASLQIQEPLRLQERLNRLIQTAETVLELDRVNILLADSEGQWLQAVASIRAEEPLAAIRVPIGAAGGALAEAYRTQHMIVCDDRAPLPDALRLKPPYDQIKSLRSRAFALVPLVVQGRAIGVLGADRKHTRQPLDVATLELLQLFASQAAVGVENARLYEEQRLAAIQLEARVEDRTRELKVTNVHLEAASRHKSEFLANMSHELRTPLNAILGFSELLQNQAFGPVTEKQGRYVGHIHASGKHLLVLINDLLDLSKVEAGKIELRPEAFVLHEALTATLTEIRLQAEAKQLQLELQVDPSLTTLTADPVRLKQIVLNLLSNAVKFTPEGGAVTVSASPLTSGWIEIAVQDTGIGIKAEDLPKLFQPFTQLESPVTMRNQGTGLGLALTKHLVELHGGTIVAASEGEGRGSTFTVCLPHPPER